MKNNHRKIEVLLKMFKNIDLFYSVSIGRFSNTLQAEYNCDLALELPKLKFKLNGIDVNGYINFIRGNISIVLT